MTLKQKASTSSWDVYDVWDGRSPEVFGTVSRTQIKSDLLIFGKQLSLIHTACALTSG